MEFFVNNIYTIVLFPLWVFFLIVIGRFFDLINFRKTYTGLTLLSTLYGLIFSVGAFLFIQKTPDFVYENSFNFIKVGDFALKVGVYVDNLSVMMILVVSAISFIVQFYSHDYMHNDRSFPRFFAYLNLFNFAMLGLVLSSTLFQTYIFWELVGVASYLLIGFWYKRPSASFAAKKAFIMNRIGDFALLTGVISFSYFMYQFSNDLSLATIPYTNINDVANYLYSYTNDFTFIFVCVMLLFGSIAKSAQFPLHTWLADAMEGPTPVSALIHSATMVAAGVYLVARLYPVYSQNDSVMTFIAIIGLITAIICAFFAMTQNDLKRILAYSTNSQLGLMFLALGAGAYSGALFHLVTHAFFKSMLFLCSGIVIHSLHEQQDIRFMGGLRKYLPVASICYLIGCISISGLLFSGFFSKEMMLSSMISDKYYLYSIGFLLVSLMTAFYMFRSYFVVFEGEFRFSKQPHKSTLIFNSSVSLLALFTLGLGYLLKDNFVKYIQLGAKVTQSPEINPIFISVSVATIGLLLSYLLYMTKIKPVKLPLLYKLSANRFYIDFMYDAVFGKVYYVFSKFVSIIDKYLVDGIVKLVAINTRALAWIFSKLQTGNFQSYLAYSLMFMAFVFAGLMLAYSIIISWGVASSY